MQALPVPLASSLPRPAWLLSRGEDQAIIALPLLVAAFAVVGEGWVRGPLADASPLAMWTAQNVLGNNTHVILTFVLLATRRDVLFAVPLQKWLIALGLLVTGSVCAALFALQRVEPELGMALSVVLFNCFGLHHTLSQSKGLWGLYSGRQRAAGGPAPSPLEDRLMRAYVPVMLAMMLTRLFFVAETPRPGDTPVMELWQGSPLPAWFTVVLLAVWLGYWLLVMRTVLRAPGTTLPRRAYLLSLALQTGLLLIAPRVGNIVLLGMHGTEYILLSRRLLEPREGDQGGLPRWMIWPLMALAMLPFFLTGLVALLHLEAVSAFSAQATLSRLRSDLTWQLYVTGTHVVVLWHYWTDAVIFRMRVPQIRAVMSRRLAAPPAAESVVPAGVPA